MGLLCGGSTPVIPGVEYQLSPVTLAKLVLVGERLRWVTITVLSILCAGERGCLPHPQPVLCVRARAALLMPRSARLPLLAGRLRDCAAPVGPAVPTAVRVRSWEAHWPLSGGHDQDGECHAALGSQISHLSLPLSSLSLFALSSLLVSSFSFFGTFPFSASSMSSPCLGGGGEERSLILFPCLSLSLSLHLRFYISISASLGHCL